MYDDHEHTHLGGRLPPSVLHGCLLPLLIRFPLVLLLLRHLQTLEVFDLLLSRMLLRYYRTECIAGPRQRDLRQTVQLC